MYELYGIREQDFSGAYDAWQAGLHPDDLARGDAAIAAAIDGVKDFNIEFRVLWPNGEVHNIEAHALVQRDVDGRAIRMIGVNWDITERERATQTIRLQAEQYATMLATTSDGFWLLDRNGRFLTVNEAYCRMTGYSREELLRLGIGDIEGVESAKATESPHGNDSGNRASIALNRCTGGKMAPLSTSRAVSPSGGPQVSSCALHGTLPIRNGQKSRSRGWRATIV